jgi:hypothetical protein
MRITKAAILTAFTEAYTAIRKEQDFTTRTGYSQVLNRDAISNVAYGAWDEIRNQINFIETGHIAKKIPSGVFGGAAYKDFCSDRIKIIIEHKCPGIKMKGDVFDITMKDILKIKDKDLLRELGVCLALQGIGTYLATGKTHFLTIEGMQSAQDILTRPSIDECKSPGI